MDDNATAGPAPEPAVEKPTEPKKKRGDVAPLFRGKYVWQQRWFQMMLAALVIFLVLSFVVPGVLGVLYAVRSVLVPVLVGLALAYIFNPVLRAAERRLKVGRLAGTISLMLMALVVVAVMLVTAVPLTISQGSSLIETVREAYPRYIDRVLAQIDTPEAEEAVEPVAEAGGGVPADEGDDAESDGVETAEDNSLVDRFIDPDRNRRLLELSVERMKELDAQMIAGWALQSLDVGVGLVGSAISFTSYLLISSVVVAFCFFFFAWKFDAILAWFEPFIPAHSHDRTLDMLRKMDQAVSSFVRGRVIQSVVMATVLAIGWPFVGVPYWFLLAVLTGLMNLVPFLPAAGWLLALVLTVMTTLANGGDVTVALVLWPTVVYFVAQGLDGYVIEPIVQGKATNLDPLSVLLVVLVGGSLAGLLGMLLAIPLAACVKILAKEMLLPKLRGLASEA
ncbi:MAG: AI-2E family transporter [Planctomycetota bacterium]